MVMLTGEGAAAWAVSVWERRAIARTQAAVRIRIRLIEFSCNGTLKSGLESEYNNSDMSRSASHTSNKPSSPAPKTRALRLHGTIARELGIAIVSGRYSPGDLLDGEIASSEQFAVSRTAYREAVRILAAKGLVDARPKIGTRINPQTKWNLLDPDVLEWTFESEPDLILLNSLFELRNVVESAAAGLAATRRTAAHLEAMRVALDGMAAHTLATPEGRQGELDFHTTLLNATGNPYII